MYCSTHSSSVSTVFSCQPRCLAGRTSVRTAYKDVFLCAENEETEGSEGQADYLFGDAELDDDDLYSMEHDNQAGWSTHPRKKHQNVNIECEMCFWSAQYFMSQRLLSGQTLKELFYKMDLEKLIV